ncbi:SAGA-associated factor 29 homolog A isoform X3 [Cryptomeria japonica]|uniref:SAGA-associated factor 29 homolog A isoform X3 n=1 Tax=Cryptomeria japonica TaxID=3369 RepID=UPI0025AB6099|nr:SAGA-associated factor 29 homolog A isoform X3 [Cryptomeria japonica]
MAVYESANQNLKTMFYNRREQDAIIQKINKVHQKLARTPPESALKYGDKLWLKLRSLYVAANKLAECEVTVSIDLISQLDTIESVQTVSQQRKQASDQKRRWVKADRDCSRLASSIVSQRTPAEHVNFAVGDQVAARVTPDNADKDEWIVVKVTRFDKDTANYEVIDEEPGDDEETGQTQRKYKLQPSCIIPFPKPTDPSSTPEFPNGRQVLAVYPGTTALYKATVAISHRKKKTDNYLLEFDDDEEDGVDGLPKRLVPFYHIVPLPEGHRQ